jgi:radical SAM protein with 4Fe4S-binding SPASM domain
MQIKTIGKLRSLAAAVLLKYGMSRYDDNKISSMLIKAIFRKLMGSGLLIHLKLDLTERCNRRCEYCYSKRRDIEPSLPEIKKLFSEVKGFIYRLDLLGGEPMLRQDIYEVIQAAKKTGKIRLVTIFTNGTLVDKEAALRLKQAGLNAAFVSFFSSTPEIQDNISGCSGTFEKKLSGIKALIQEGIKTYTFTVINKSNLKDIESMNNLVRGLGARPLFFNQIPVNDKDISLQLSSAEVYKAKNLLKKINPGRMSRVYNMFKFTGHSCFGGYFMASVKVDGSLTHCPFIYDVVLGNAFKENIFEIFKKRFTVGEFEKIYNPPADCLCCFFVDYCRGGCKAGNKAVLNEYSKKCFYCLGPWQRGRLDSMDNCIPYWF